jgi:hypothetical protein
MRAILRVDQVHVEPSGSFLTGEIITGILLPGMEAVTSSGVFEVSRIMNEARTKNKRRALPTQRISVISAEVFSPPALKELVGQDLEFTDQKLISLKKGIFLSAEPS